MCLLGNWNAKPDTRVKLSVGTEELQSIWTIRRNEKIEPTIWRTNKLTGTVDFKNILLTSRVVNNEGNEILRSILETGKADENAEDNYSKNYRHFQELFDKHSTGNGYFGKKKRVHSFQNCNY